MREAFIAAMRDAPRGRLFDQVASALHSNVGTHRPRKGWFVLRR